MTDYIEALLAEQEERERGETAELDAPPVVLPPEAGAENAPPGGWPGGAAGRDETREGSPTGGGPGAARAAGGEEPRPPGVTDGAARAAAPPGQGAETPLADALRAAEQAGAAGRLLRGWRPPEAAEPEPGRGGPAGGEAGGGRPSGAAWLAEAVGRSLRPAVETAGRSGGSVTVLRQTERGGGRVEAEELDRIFRRDARRYDGGFQLL